jgi:hypothetical protein
MPTDACQYIYHCKACGHQMKPKKGDCCVFCSYGDVPCRLFRKSALAARRAHRAYAPGDHCHRFRLTERQTLALIRIAAQVLFSGQLAARCEASDGHDGDTTLLYYYANGPNTMDSHSQRSRTHGMRE